MDQGPFIVSNMSGDVVKCRCTDVRQHPATQGRTYKTAKNINSKYIIEIRLRHSVSDVGSWLDCDVAWRSNVVFVGQQFECACVQYVPGCDGADDLSSFCACDGGCVYFVICVGCGRPSFAEHGVDVG
eukprot:13625907-Ditylum_brightwellii.AAC.1